MANCIVLNKAFTGSWLSNDSNIAHEIINFFKADDNNIYVYCAPHGQVPNVPNLQIKFLFLTSETQENNCDLLYCFKIKHVLHNQCKFSHGITSETNNKKRRKAKEEISNNLKRLSDEGITNYKSWEEIKYGGISIKDLFADDFEVYPVTFIVESVYKATKNIKFDAGIMSQNGDYYNYQRNFGFVIDDDPKRRAAYNKLIELAPVNIETGALQNIENWNIVDFSNFTCLDINNPIDKEKIDSVKKNLFLDLVDNYKAEECYTKIIHKLFKTDNILIKKFLNECVLPKIDENLVNNYDINEENFLPLTELAVKYGRIDNFAYSNRFALIIENKIDAEFTMRKEGNNSISQLKRYYDWANDNSSKFKTNLADEEKISNKKKIYVILAPDYRFEQIVMEEQKLRAVEGFERYYVVKYSELYNLIKDWNPNNFNFNKYLKDIKLLIYRLSLTQDELYKAKLSEQLYERNLK